MNSPLTQMLEAIPAAANEQSDESYVQCALNEFRRNSRSRSEFRQQATLTPERVLSAGELQALQRVGLHTDAQTQTDAERARQESLYVFFRAYQSALPTSEVASLLDVNTSRVRQRIKERTLLALNDAGESRFPALQFHQGRELPGLREVLPALPENIKVLEALSWFATPTVELADADDTPRSPRDYLLATGESAPVIELAKALQRGQAA
jgi:hypothetical protein